MFLFSLLTALLKRLVMFFNQTWKTKLYTFIDVWRKEILLKEIVQWKVNINVNILSTILKIFYVDDLSCFKNIKLFCLKSWNSENIYFKVQLFFSCLFYIRVGRQLVFQVSQIFVGCSFVLVTFKYPFGLLFSNTKERFTFKKFINLSDF